MVNYYDSHNAIAYIRRTFNRVQYNAHFCNVLQVHTLYKICGGFNARLQL